MVEGDIVIPEGIEDEEDVEDEEEGAEDVWWRDYSCLACVLAFFIWHACHFLFFCLRQGVVPINFWGLRLSKSL